MKPAVNVMVTDELIEEWAVEFHNQTTPAGTPFYNKMTFAEYVEIKKKAISKMAA
ncbi:hypothetical protein [Halalkalibacter oceani]|uniref:hypothetical protein n=1 Tax=Halalkalibacter oceani TaxID=1653776 RepID=UPI0033987170